MLVAEVQISPWDKPKYYEIGDLNLEKGERVVRAQVEFLKNKGLHFDTAIRNMRRIICCSVVFARSAKTTLQQVFSFFSKDYSKF